MNEHPSNRALKDIKIQNNDMGIAMCHFELAADALGLKGCWVDEKPDNAPLRAGLYRQLERRGLTVNTTYLFNLAGA
jgi:predicted hotdog family 3-hydroxylacyl-ACP dehydratase